jgi:hypothetical protein
MNKCVELSRYSHYFMNLLTHYQIKRKKNITSQILRWKSQSPKFQVYASVSSSLGPKLALTLDTNLQAMEWTTMATASAYTAVFPVGIP